MTEGADNMAQAAATGEAPTMPYFIVDIWYYERPAGLSSRLLRHYSVRPQGFASEEDAEAVVATEGEQRQQRRAEWERMHAQPFPSEDHYVVRAEDPNGALAALRERLGPMPGDRPNQDAQEELNKDLIAAAAGYPEWVAGLLAAGAAPNAFSGFPLIMAIQANDTPDIVQAMFAAGADPNRPFDDTTPLVHAAAGRSPGVVRALIEAGADVNLRAPKGVTPLERAYAPGPSNASADDREEIRQLLLAAGARER